jgi:hypothetical protein
MIRVIQVEAEVPESRQVTVTLPPDVPADPLRLTVMYRVTFEGPSGVVEFH